MGRNIQTQQDRRDIRRDRTHNAGGLELVGTPNGNRNAKKYGFTERARSSLCAATKPRDPTTRVRKGPPAGARRYSQHSSERQDHKLLCGPKRKTDRIATPTTERTCKKQMNSHDAATRPQYPTARVRAFTTFIRTPRPQRLRPRAGKDAQDYFMRLKRIQNEREKKNAFHFSHSGQSRQPDESEDAEDSCSGDSV